MNTDNDTDARLKELVELARLYDVYGPLLNDHMKGIFEDYIMNNLSLSEIAETEGLSRQGVRDIIVRCSGKLRDYEAKLGFAERFDRCRSVLIHASGKPEGSLDVDKLLSDTVSEIRSILDI